MASGLMSPELEPFITEPGRYDMPDSVYHADPVVGGSLSSTGARTILRSAAKFFHYRAHGSAPKAAFDEGSAAHMLVLGQGPELVVIEGDGADVNAWRTASDKLRVREARDAGKIPLKPEQHAMVMAMAQALRENTEIAELLSNGTAEEAFFAKHPATGMWMRGKTDYRHADHTVIDYKTSAKPVDPDTFARTMSSLDYHVQFAFYKHILVLLGLIEPSARFLVIAQEKEEPYLASVLHPDTDAMAYGHAMVEEAMALYQRCVFSGEWPGYPAEPQRIGLAGWKLKAYQERGIDPVYTDRVTPALERIADARTRAELKGVMVVFSDVKDHVAVRAAANDRWAALGKMSGIA